MGGHWPGFPGGGLEILIFLRREPEKDAKPTTKPSIKPPEALRGPGRPPEAPEGPLKSPPPFSRKALNRALETRPRIKARQIRGEWEFRALARNPKRYKVGWMPA